MTAQPATAATTQYEPCEECGAPLWTMRSHDDDRRDRSGAVAWTARTVDADEPGVRGSSPRARRVGQDRRPVVAPRVGRALRTDRSEGSLPRVAHPVLIGTVTMSGWVPRLRTEVLFRNPSATW